MRFPLVPCYLATANDAAPGVPVWMLLDSGANESFLPRFEARRVGIVPDGHAVRTVGAGGTFWARRAEVSIQLAGSTTVRRMEVCIPSGRRDLEAPVLGRIPFFLWYKVEFDELDQRFRLHER